MECSHYDILCRLIFSHLLVDFVLQTNKCVQRKVEKKWFYHLIHSLLQASLAYILVGQWTEWIIWPVVFFTHLGIDYWKVTRAETGGTFLFDQFLHLLVIFLLWLFITNQYDVMETEIIHQLTSSKPWIVLIGYLVIWQPTSILLGLFTRRWQQAIQTNMDESDAPQSLQDAGKWIGYLERTLILTFIWVGKIEMIGFLLAAKSIFRFGELNKSKEIKTTEYVLIGTFASFTIAIIWGLILIKLIDNL